MPEVELVPVPMPVVVPDVAVGDDRVDVRPDADVVLESVELDPLDPMLEPVPSVPVDPARLEDEPGVDNELDDSDVPVADEPGAAVVIGGLASAADTVDVNGELGVLTLLLPAPEMQGLDSVGWPGEPVKGRVGLVWVVVVL
jgi:hypothetical protein